MARALDVARYLLQLAAAEEEPENLTHLRLQKLLYYTQGWSLALRKKTLFSSQIEAWANGPVVRDVWGFYKDSKNAVLETPEGELADGLSAEEAEHVQAVWDEYKKYSAWSLRDMTHREPPWKNARRGYDPADRCEVEIRPDAMREYFTTLAG